MLKVFTGCDDAYALLAKAVEVTWGWVELPTISRLPGGKPVFSDRLEYHFNLSHSCRMTLCALSDSPVGVDLEIIQPRRESLPERLFQGAEYIRYLSLGGDWSAFYMIWTERESIVKYTGKGLQGLRQEQIPEGCKISCLTEFDWVASICCRETVDSWEQL